MSDPKQPAADEPAGIAETSPEISDIPVNPKKHPGAGRWKSFWQKYWDKKKIMLPLTAGIIAGALLAVPVTRYAILGLFVKENFKVVILDTSTRKPVSNAVVTIKGVSVKSDAKGNASLKLPVGSGPLSVSKKYYKTTTATVLVPLRQKDALRVFVLATGRQVPVTVVNKITGKPVANAVLAAAGTEAKTDKAGKAVIVLPAGQKTVKAKVKSTGFNDLDGTVTVTEQTVAANTFSATPAGKIYFLSKQSGKIDVVKTDLDGENRQTVVAGTGKEESYDTILLASRDWKYLVLKSKRDGGENAKLFLIDAASDKLSTIEEGNATFSLIGWADHRFAYQVNRKGFQNNQPKAQALKAYDATTGKLSVIDETDAEGSGGYDYAFNRYGSTYLINNELVFFKNWSASNTDKLQEKSVSLVSTKLDGSARHTIKEFPVPESYYNYYYIETRPYAPDELYIRVPLENGGSDNAIYEYEDGKVTQKDDTTDEEFYGEYPTYLQSPSGKQAFWSDSRDGKSVLFVGDADAKNEKQIATLSEFNNYGWFTDNYLLLTKNGSELYIMPSVGGTPLKVSDYHKPTTDFRGYGGGYGGL